MEMLQTAVASLGMFYPGPEGLTGRDIRENLDYIHSMTVKILARMATLVAMWEHIRNGYDPVLPRTDLSYAENFLYMLTGKEPDPFHADIMDTCLVLHAEHTINASTFAALVAGSTPSGAQRRHCRRHRHLRSAARRGERESRGDAARDRQPGQRPHLGGETACGQGQDLGHGAS